MKSQQFEIPVGKQVLHAEFNDLAVQANGSVILSMGNTSVMATAVMGGASPYNDGGLALRVDYEERYYARGAILGSRFNKREGKPTTEATLTSRIIDRSIRPYFPDDFGKEVQVVVTVLSLGEYDPDMLAVNAASLALGVSDIPWEGPIACVRISQDKENENLTVNPLFKERKTEHNYYNSIISGVEGSLHMIELDGAQVEHKDFLVLCRQGIELVGSLEGEFRAIVKQIGKEKREQEHQEEQDLLLEVFTEKFQHVVSSRLSNLLDTQVVNFWKSDFKKSVRNQDSDFVGNTDVFFEKQIKRIVREAIVQDGERIDGRALNEVRPIYAQAGGLVGKQHGSGIFYRGDTHVLSVLTLGSLEDDLLHHHEMEVDGTQRWMHHYNFPDYSVGEVGRMGSPRRREIGHGVLAAKALERMLPPESEFPYALRVVSEVMSSNGSTSMASTCAASLALMDGGVPIREHVAGVACGLVQEESGQVILTDILGKEDFYGDIDFKIAGTRTGITAVQLDCKNKGLTFETIEQTLEASHKARLQIIDQMEEELPSPRELTPLVEKIVTYSIPEDKIGLVIGKGGATIKHITKESEAKIDIKRDGTAYITGNEDAPKKAQQMIEEIIASAE